MNSSTRTVIANGTVVDGSGGDPFLADVIISGDRIEAILASGVRPRTPYDAVVVDATGLVVAPGFVDIHCHSDLTRFAYPGHESRVTQGITTEVVGNCGMSAAPVGADPVGLSSLIATIDVTPETPRKWNTVNEWLEALDQADAATNVAALVGHGSARHAAARGTGEVPSIGSVAREVRDALEAGCVGASLGLMYAPGESADPAELQAVGLEVVRAGGLLAAHLRDYRASSLRSSVEEVVNASAGARVQISHLRATSAEPGFDESLAFVEEMRTSLDVAADCYPYVAGHATLIQLLPPTLRARGPRAILEMGNDSSLLAMMLRDAGWRADQIVLMKAGRSPEAVGETPANHPDPWRWLADILLANDGLVDVAVASGFWPDVDNALGRSWVTVGSDGTALSAEHRSSAPHPRSWGAFPAAFRRMRDHGVSLAEAVRRMSVASAERVRVSSGLTPGAPADVVVFDEISFDSTATFADPAKPSVGLAHVYVNGSAVLSFGAPTLARPGRLRRRGDSS